MYRRTYLFLPAFLRLRAANFQRSDTVDKQLVLGLVHGYIGMSVRVRVGLGFVYGYIGMSVY